MEGIPEKDMQDRRRTLEQKSQGLCLHYLFFKSIRCSHFVFYYELKAMKAFPLPAKKNSFCFSC